MYKVEGGDRGRQEKRIEEQERRGPGRVQTKKRYKYNRQSNKVGRKEQRESKREGGKLI